MGNDFQKIASIDSSASIFRLRHRVIFTWRNANIAVKIYKQNHFILFPSVLCFPICSVCIRLKCYL